MLRSVVARSREVDWTFLLACVAWLLLSLLLLLVKLGKKSDAFPVLLLVAAWLLYMNAGDLFGSFRLYAVACAQRRTLVHLFVSAAVLGLLSRSYGNALGVLLTTAAVVARAGWSRPTWRASLVALGLAALCLGFCTGAVLSVAMVREAPLAAPAARSGEWPVPLALVVVLAASRLLPHRRLRGQVQTALASGLVAATSAVASPLAVVAVAASMNELFPDAVSSVTTFVPQLARAKLSMWEKLKAATTVAFWHGLGALAGAAAAGAVPDTQYGPQEVIAHEFMFSAIVGFVASRDTRLVPLAALGGCLATGGAVHMHSAVSLALAPAAAGCLAGRLIWQLAGSWTGAFLLAPWADAARIDFDPITAAVRTTDGRLVRREQK